MLRYQVEVEATRLKLASEGLLHSQHKQDTEGAHYYFKENERRISKKEYKLQECRRERDGWRERSADEHLASSSFYVCVVCKTADAKTFHAMVARSRKRRSNCSMC